MAKREVNFIVCLAYFILETNGLPFHNYASLFERSQATPNKRLPPVFGSKYPQESDFVNEIENMNPIKNNLMEGDIIVTARSQTGRTIYTKQSTEWPHFHVPYLINEGIPAKQITLIRRAMAVIEKSACQLRFVQKHETDINYINIVPHEDECSSVIGRVGGAQPLNLHSRCGFVPILHELMHAIGFIHEHNRSDRDDYIQLYKENIKKGGLKAFNKYKLSEENSYKMVYDVLSIMHYGAFFFSKNDKPTIQVRDELVDLYMEKIPGMKEKPREEYKTFLNNAMGNQKGLSAIDKMKLHIRYCDVDNV